MCRNIHSFPGNRIQRRSRIFMHDSEIAKSAQIDAISLFQRISDGGKETFDDRLRLRFGEASAFRDHINNVGFCHNNTLSARLLVTTTAVMRGTSATGAAGRGGVHRFAVRSFASESEGRNLALGLCGATSYAVHMLGCGV